ncbi:hypothetical protein HY637_03735 [Candidatus Woesearchaeota archaeon]|nr:hypothetical protein [Candidatus Woesearchaeota archaeon]
MIKKTITLAFLLVFSILASSFAYAGHSSQFDISIDRVVVNNQAISQSKNNLLPDADTFIFKVDLTAVRDLEKAHVEVSMRGRQSNDAVADSTDAFNMLENQSARINLALSLNDGLKRENNFELIVKVTDSRGRSEQKSYGIKTKQTTNERDLDVSIDRVKVNNQVVTQSRTNFIEEKDDFNVAVELTALENVERAHVEAILKDRNSGSVVADATENFNLADNSNTQKQLKLVLLDKLKKSSNFELTVKIVDAEGDSLSQAYGITMKNGKADAKQLDVSFDRVEIEDKVVIENQENFVVTGESTKQLDVRVSFTSNENIENARLETILMFENGNVIADSSQATFNLTQDQKAVKDLELELPGKFKQDRFQLKLRLVDTDGNSIEKSYNMKIAQQKFPFVISTITLNPEDKAQAGKSLGINLVFKNSGVLPLEGIFAKASIEELGLSSTKYIDPLKNKGKELISEEFIIKIPETAQTETYTLKAEIGSQLDSKKETKEIQFEIAGKTEFVFEDISLTSIKVPVIKQDVASDGREALYKVVITNEDTKPNSYTISLDGNGWADLRLKETSAFVLNAHESKSINVYASTTKDLASEQRFFVVVKSNDKVLREITFKANVVSAKRANAFYQLDLKSMIQISLILMTLVLVAIGVFYGLKNVARKDNGEESAAGEEMPQSEPYY